MADTTIWVRNSSAGDCHRGRRFHLGIKRINQPDVEASKCPQEADVEYEQTGSLPPEKPVVEDGAVKLFTDGEERRRAGEGGSETNLSQHILRAHLGRIGAGGYFALLGYIQMNEEPEKPMCSGKACGARQEACGLPAWVSDLVFCIRQDRLTKEDQTPEFSCR